MRKLEKRTKLKKKQALWGNLMHPQHLYKRVFPIASWMNGQIRMPWALWTLQKKDVKKIVIIVVVIDSEEAKIFKKKLGIGIRMP